MAKSSTVSEQVELQDGGEVSIYISGNRVALTLNKNDLEAVIWITKEEAQQYADKINHALSEAE